MNCKAGNDLVIGCRQGDLEGVGFVEQTQLPRLIDWQLVITIVEENSNDTDELNDTVTTVDQFGGGVKICKIRRG